LGAIPSGQKAIQAGGGGIGEQNGKDRLGRYE